MVADQSKYSKASVVQNAVVLGKLFTLLSSFLLKCISNRKAHFKDIRPEGAGTDLEEEAEDEDVEEVVSNIITIHHQPISKLM
jgi:hypothetical protein